MNKRLAAGCLKERIDNPGMHATRFRCGGWFCYVHDTGNVELVDAYSGEMAYICGAQDIDAIGALLRTVRAELPEVIRKERAAA